MKPPLRQRSPPGRIFRGESHAAPRPRSSIGAGIEDVLAASAGAVQASAARLAGTIAIEVTSAGLLRKAMPSPNASRSGNTKTQKTTSGSRLQFEQARHQQMLIARPAPVRPLAAQEGLRHPGAAAFAPGGGHQSSLKWRPVRFTNTSSRLAWRVVRCRSSAPLVPTASSSAGMVRCGSRTVSEQTPLSSRTPSTPGRTRQCSLRRGRCRLADAELDHVMSAETVDQFGRRTFGDDLARDR